MGVRSTGALEVASAQRGAEADASPAASQARVLDAYASLPLSFVENRGQTDGRVRYFAQGARYGFFLTPEALVMSLLEPDGANGVALSLGLRRGQSGRRVEAAQRAPREGQLPAGE